MKKKNIFTTLLFIIIFILTIYKLDDITDFLVKYISSTPEVALPPSNQYARNMNYEYVQKTDNFIPYGKQDIFNIFYSYLDNGYDNLTFYCPKEYENCIKDITDIINNQTIITDIGNFVHPFNNFRDVFLSTSTSGEVNLKITRTYSDEEITLINNKIDEILNKIFTPEMDLNDKILAAHDYIIDNTTYDETKNEDLNAYNLLYENKSKCFGYADAMAIILDKLNVKSFKVGSNAHVWNAIYLNNEWSHIDVTWDDPIILNGTSISSTIRHKFYLIDTKTLLEYDPDEHNFDQKVYYEFSTEKATS